MPGLSHSRSDKVVCCSFPTLEAIKFVHWVNRFERPLPSNSFQVHHYLLSFSTARVSLHHRHGSVPADISAVSWSASAGVASTALIFSTSVSPPFSPAVADSKLGDGALAMLLLPEPLPNWLYQLRAHSWQEKPRAFICIVLALVLTAPEVRGWFCSVPQGDHYLLRCSHAAELAAMCRVCLVSPPASPLVRNHRMFCQQLCAGGTEPRSWCFVKYNLFCANLMDSQNWLFPKIDRWEDNAPWKK